MFQCRRQPRRLVSKLPISQLATLMEEKDDGFFPGQCFLDSILNVNHVFNTWFRRESSGATLPAARQMPSKSLAMVWSNPRGFSCARAEAWIRPVRVLNGGGLLLAMIANSLSTASSFPGL